MGCSGAWGARAGGQASLGNGGLREGDRAARHRPSRGVAERGAGRAYAQTHTLGPGLADCARGGTGTPDTDPATGDDVQGHTRSITAAMPCPTPMHMVVSA